ncbi:MAG TPA: hypothetical protein VNA20_15945 [Frankiaceae bacterium]|nr:hypothetical protein [Frankiaceae bacterium]
MTRLPRGDDRGVAALEMGIFASVLLLLAFGALPLYAMLRASQRVSKASAGTLRYATSVAANGTRVNGTLSRRPTYDEVVRFACEAAGDDDLAVEVVVCKGATCTPVTDGPAPIPAVAGDTVEVTLGSTVDLSVLGRIANAAANLSGGDDPFPENETTVTATASAREE